MKKVGVALAKAVKYVRSYWSHILSTLLILMAISVVYRGDFEVLANEALHNEAASHIILVPFLVGFLLYKQRDLVKALQTLENSMKKTTFKYLDEVIGLALCLVAFLLYWYGSYTFYPLEYHLLSLPIFVAGIVIILFSLRTVLVLAFPILFLLFLIPPPAEIMYIIGGAMGNFNTQASYTILHTLGLPVTLQSSYGPPTIAITSSTGQPLQFAIDLACSGIYSLIAFSMFATFLAYITVAPILKKAGIFALGFTVFAVINVARITTIVSVGYWFGEETAMLIFHTVTGWLLILAGMFFILLIAEKFWNVQITQSAQEKAACSTCNSNNQTHEKFCSKCGRFLSSISFKISRKFWSKLLLLLLFSYLITLSIQAPTFVIARGPAGVTSNPNWENSTNIFPQIPNYRLKFLYRDTNYEKIARQDASLLYAYLPNTTSNPKVYADIGVANTISNLHSWEVCLITWQINRGRNPLVTTLDSRDIQLLQDTPIIARYLVFESPLGYTQVTLYWFEKATVNTGVTVEQKYVRISLIILTQNSTNYLTLENQLLPVAQSIASYWEPLKTQSLISIGIPMQQSLLVLATAFVAVTKTVEHTQKWRKKNSNLRIFNSFATAEEKLVLKTIQELTKKAKTVQTSLIAETLTTETNNPFKIEDLTDILERLETYNLIRREVVNVKGKPLQTWKM